MKWCFASLPKLTRTDAMDEKTGKFGSALPASDIFTTLSNMELAQRRWVCSISCDINYMSWKAGKTKGSLVSEESKMNKCILVWEICIFSARISSSTMKELARKCRIFSLNDFLKGFSGSSSYLVLLRQTKIIHYEKYCCVYSLFLCFVLRQLVEIRQNNTNWQLGHEVKRAAR